MKLTWRSRIIVLLCLLSQGAFAQWQLKTDITTGYEHNIFRNPRQLIYDADTLGTDELFNNSAYTEVFMRFAYKKELEKSRYKIKANLSNTRYFSEGDAQRYTFEFKGDYRVKLATKKYLEIGSRFYRRLRQAELEENDAIFRTPYAYTQIDVPLSLDFYLKKHSWFKIQPLYTFRQYDQTTFSNSLRYHAWFVQFLFKKRWQNPKAEHKFEVSANVGTRYYRDSPASSLTQDEIAAPERRIWHYTELEMSYRVEFKDGKIAFSIPFRYINRYDQLPSMFSFQEQSLGAELRLKNKGSLFIPSIRYSLRNYGQILADNQELLQYNLIFGRLYYKKRISSVMEVLLKTDWNIRISNRKRMDTRYFRGYTNYLIELGLIYRLR